jgi:hypothetical protein
MTDLDAADSERYKQAVFRFLKRRDARLERAEVFEQLEAIEMRRHPNLGAFHVFGSTFGEFWVSEREAVIGYRAPGRMTASEAQHAAKEVLRQEVEDFGLRNFTQQEAGFVDPIWKEEWKEQPRPGEVSIFENWAQVQINVETRKLHYFQCSDVQHVRLEPPVLDEDAASGVLKRHRRLAVVDSMNLMEHTDDGGHTWTTIWNVIYMPGGDPSSPLEIIAIDADTGDIVDIEW